MIKLPADVKKRWLDALRSGKYKQGQSRLYDGSNHCCLGVLYEVMGGTWIATSSYTTTNRSRCYIRLGDVPEEVYDVLNQQVTESFRVQHRLGRINDKSTDYNDVITCIENNL